MSSSRLEAQVLAAFRRAEAEGHRDAAEHLMRALEALCPYPNMVPGGSALSDAYHDVAQRAPSALASSKERRTTRRGIASKRLH